MNLAKSNYAPYQTQSLVKNKNIWPYLQTIIAMVNYLYFNLENFQ